ncbi:MAG: hypothetical protein Q7R34_12795 [Dehalococcoidia bacterium]|nr:hypothetical protein [Dehalococcoidia bacterium]
MSERQLVELSGLEFTRPIPTGPIFITTSRIDVNPAASSKAILILVEPLLHKQASIFNWRKLHAEYFLLAS